MKVRSVGVRRVWDSETPSLLSYTLRYVSFAEVGVFVPNCFYYSRIKKGEGQGKYVTF